MKKIIYIVSIAIAVLCINSCEEFGLDQYPHSSTTSKDVYNSVENYQAVLSGLYATYIQRDSKVSTEDRSQNYLRVLMMFQDCSTDACDDIWLAGESLTPINGLSWAAGDSWVSAMYYHIYNIVSISNELIRNAADDKISGFSEGDRAKIVSFRNEARFIRAWAYSHAMDFYPKMPFISENDEVGSFIPPVYTRQQMFDYLVSELSELGAKDTGLPVTNYGHANRGAANALLARIYLNGETYTGKAYYTECISACKAVIEDGYSLEPDYSSLFNADNHLRTNEIIFALACDAAHTTTWDATTFITCGCVLGDFADYEKVYGTENSGAWNCLRVRPELVNAFESGDSRAMFIGYDRMAYSDWTADLEASGYYRKDGDTDYIYKDRDINIIGHDETTTGYRVCKWTNLKDDGTGSNCGDGGGANTDFPVFRLADVYLMIAEAQLRGGSGATLAEAANYFNQVRERAFGDRNHNIAQGDIDLQTILDERLREMYMECIRRTDLIRFGKYTSGYNWQWKGGVLEGKDVDSKYAYLPIPETELSVNPSIAVVNQELGY